jgi:hypothetical protein
MHNQLFSIPDNPRETSMPERRVLPPGSAGGGPRDDSGSPAQELQQAPRQTRGGQEETAVRQRQ